MRAGTTGRDWGDEDRDCMTGDNDNDNDRDRDRDNDHRDSIHGSRPASRR